MKSVIQISSKKGELQGSREDHPESNLRPNRTTPAQVSFFFNDWLVVRATGTDSWCQASCASSASHPPTREPNSSLGKLKSLPRVRESDSPVEARESSSGMGTRFTHSGSRRVFIGELGCSSRSEKVVAQRSCKYFPL